MVASLAIFAAGKRHYAVEVIGPPKKKTEEERRQQRRVLARLFGVFALMVFFWSVYEQNDNLWVAFAENHVDLTLDLGFWSYKFAPDGYQFINPLLILILVPLFGWMWRKIDPEVKYFKPARKIFIGFVVTLATALLMTIAATIAGDTGKVSSWWMIVGYSVLTVAEILVYGTGLELSYAEAPANMKGFITACFLLTIGAADLVNIGLSELYKKMPEAQFYGLMTIVMLGGTIAFFFVGRRFSQDAPVLNETQNYQDLG
jgi:POT family proton-dependent oligopeptide transporter